MTILPQLSSVLSSLWHRRLISGPQQKFVLHLLLLWPAVRGRYNLLNLSRYSSYHEQSFRRHFAKEFAWGAFNAALIQALVPRTHELMLAQDAWFVRKSGKKTCGLGHFYNVYNGCAQRPERGLELSLVSVVDLTQNTAYALHAKQSLPQTKALECPHLQHLRETQEHWPAGATFLAVDGAYARHNFVHGACELGLHVVSRLRRDANVRTLYTGPQKPRGADKLYDQKLCWKQLDLTLWCDHGELEPGVRLYSMVVNHVSLKRNIKIALLIRDKDKTSGQTTEKVCHILLFCTDLHSSGRDIVRRYLARFHIEFLFRGCPLGGPKAEPVCCIAKPQPPRLWPLPGTLLWRRSTSPNSTRGTPKARHSPGPQRTRNAPTSISCNSFVPNSNSIGVTCNPIHNTIHS